VAAARCQLLFDCGLDSRQRRAARADIGNRYRVSQSKEYRPTPIPASIGQYLVPQYQYRSNPISELARCGG